MLSTNTSSRGAVEAERVQVLDDLGRLALSYRTETPPDIETPAADTPAASRAPSPGPRPATPQAPVGGSPVTPPPSSRPERRTELGSKTVQTLLLGLGGLLVAAAIIIFTAVAWRHLGDAGRLLALVALTALMLAVPAVLIRSRLRATAETFASLAALALWCSALAGYYQFLPEGAPLSAEAVGTWTTLVLAVLVAHRWGVGATATGWALLPLAAVGSAFAAAGEAANAAVLMAATAALLAAGSQVVARRPSRSPRSDLWASRLLLCAAVVLAFLAGLRLAFGLSGALVSPIAAGVAVLAAGNLVAAAHARRSGASATSILVVSSAALAMTVTAWALAIRSGEAALAVPSLTLLAAVLTAVVDEFGGSGEAFRKAAGLASVAAPAAFAIVVADAPELTSYLVAAVLIGLLSTAMPEPLRRSLRHAAYIGGGAVAGAGGLIALSGLPSLWWDDGFPGPLTWEVPITLAVLALSAALVPERRRLDVVALTLTFAGIAASLLLREGDPARLDALPVVGFALAAVIALVGAVASDTLDGRCTSWCLMAVWVPLTASAVGAASWDVSSSQIGFVLVVAAAAMLAVAAGAPRRSRPDRVLAAVLAHALAGVTVASMLFTGWFAQLISGSDSRLYLPAAIGVYTVALTGVALMAPVKKRPYAVAALCTGTSAWWAFLAAMEAEILELFTGPPAAMLFAIGLWQLLRRPGTGSWAQLAVPIAVGIGPSLFQSLGADDPVRRVGVGIAALVVVAAGLGRRWQAPLVLGSIALLTLTVNELALVWHAIPQWIPPAVGGAILIGAGATFERRRRDLARMREAFKAMR